MSEEISFDLSGPESGASASRRKNPADPFDFGAAEDALNEAIKRANAAWLALMATMAYFLVATIKITHKDLFLERQVKLPLLNVDMPLVFFGVIAPIFVLLFHFFALLTARGLREKVSFWNETIMQAAELRKDRARLRERLDISILAQAYGRPASRYRLFISIVAEISTELMPLILYIVMQAVFLPYQNVWISDIQRLILIFGCFMVFFILPQRWVSAGFFAVIFIAASLFVLVFPDAPRSKLFPSDFVYESVPPLRAFVQEKIEGKPDLVHRVPTTIFSNRLVLPEQNLVSEMSVNGAATNLRGRRLASAFLDGVDLHGVDFTGADLRRVSMQRAQLQGARFGCAATGKTWHYKLAAKGDKERTDEDTETACVWLHGSDLTSIAAGNASFEGAFLLGANLSSATLKGSTFLDVEAQGASFFDSNLEASSFNNANLDGANLKYANMTGAVVSDSHLPGVVLDRATMIAVKMSSVDLWDASVRRVEMQASDLSRLDIRGSMLVDIAIYRGKSSEFIFYSAKIDRIFLKTKVIELIGDLYTYSPTYIRTDHNFVFDLGEDFRHKWGSVDYGTTEVSFEEILNQSPQLDEKRINDLIAGIVKHVDDKYRVSEIKDRLERLKPNYVASRESGVAIQKQDEDNRQLWDLLKKATTEANSESYERRLAARLEHIACVGGAEVAPGDLSQVAAPYVARGLMRGQRFDDIGCDRRRQLLSMLRTAMNTGKKADKTPCPGAVGLEDIDFTNEQRASQIDAACQKGESESMKGK